MERPNRRGRGVGPGAQTVQHHWDPVTDSILLGLSGGRAQEEAKPVSTLFGPALAPSSISAATGREEVSHPKEEMPISPEVVKNWVTKSKNFQEGTTTLQALVNLKSSSLRLSPLSIEFQDDTEAPNVYDAPHGLEFHYDCDAPKCKITVNAVSSKSSVTSPATTSDSILATYESVFEGGFGRMLRLEDGATLELSSIASQEVGTIAPIVHPPPTPNPEPDVVPTTPTSRKRLSAFTFRRRAQQTNVSGPALRVVDEDAVASPATLGNKDQTFVRVTIRLEALDENVQSMAIQNLQTTTLNILPAVNGGSEGTENGKHWVVHVVRKDAKASLPSSIIGSHSFRLQDIYGLSNSAQPSTGLPPPEPAAEPDASGSGNTYPPTPAIQTATGITNVTTDQDGIRSECILCLSSPREVVLLPCRHLVACKECALNMVEYGAGGQIAQPTDATGEDGGPVIGDGVVAEGGEAGVPNTAIVPPPTPRPRRRRRPKGWYCPICRQPYTSLLRIATAPVKSSFSIQSQPLVSPFPADLEVKPGLSGMLSAAAPGFLRSSRNEAVPSTGVEHPLGPSAAVPAGIEN
ncbi:uncharacterized protein EI90DRAFT_3115205 [Cantharellus anzutake]|uniref:uncharacterized protein n=1 Tax=Cantharellus anzutake TaxID=1750568 RepID=UPI001908C404|nr:uncharacterized protein EI90DRAFT_3115205 [Cantharellus anzutake]KAF8342632.1 hypothetical protein EI90DRAFT_3115205 [Cantharellus anzutake]